MAKNRVQLTKDKIILDSTSGNTGIAYALIGKVKGYKVKIVMPANVCKERKGLMADFYGAEIVTSSPFEGSDGAIILAKKIYEENPDIYFMPDQYNNDSNWKAHYETTSREIWQQTQGPGHAFCRGYRNRWNHYGKYQGTARPQSGYQVLCCRTGGRITRAGRPQSTWVLPSFPVSMMKAF